MYLVFFRGPAPNPAIQQTRFPFGPLEQAYAPKVQFANFEMSRAESYLNQEVTYLAGDVMNSGDRALSGIEATIEFQDDMKQIALRETRPVLFGYAALLPPGKTAHILRSRSAFLEHAVAYRACSRFTIRAHRPVAYKYVSEL
jgi:hypothetical protein